MPNPNSRAQFNYELVALRGTDVRPQEDPNVISGDFACQLSHENERSALSLRIQNVVRRPKLDYFINNLAEPLTYVEKEAEG